MRPTAALQRSAPSNGRFPIHRTGGNDPKRSSCFRLTAVLFGRLSGHPRGLPAGGSASYAGPAQPTALMKCFTFQMTVRPRSRLSQPLGPGALAPCVEEAALAVAAAVYGITLAVPKDGFSGSISTQFQRDVCRHCYVALRHIRNACKVKFHCLLLLCSDVTNADGAGVGWPYIGAGQVRGDPDAQRMHRLAVGPILLAFAIEFMAVGVLLFLKRVEQGYRCK